MFCKFQKTKSACLSSKAGFSLVELMIVMAIMAIMTGVVLVSKNTDKSQLNAEAAARQIAAQLRGLQSEALTGKIIDGRKACDSVFWGTSGATSYNSYHIECVTRLNIDADPPLNIKLKNVTISSNAGDFYLSFHAPNGIIGTFNMSDSDSDGIKKILVTSGSSYATVCINDRSGNIEEKKGDVDC